MRLNRLHVKNLRSLRDCEMDLGSFVSLVGPNGAGKSTVLFALNIFFRHLDAPTNVSELDREDFYNCDITQPIEITVTFGDMSKEAQQVFSTYYRHGFLIITAKAEFDETIGRAIVKQYGQRLVMPHFSKFFELMENGEYVATLKQEYTVLRQVWTDLPTASTKEQMRQALREYENSHIDLCELVPSEDQFYGFSKGANRLAEFINWVYVPAVKDASKEIVESKSTALGQILARTVRTKVDFSDILFKIKKEASEKYEQVLSEQQSALDDLSASLTTRLANWAHPGVKARLSWEKSAANTVRVDEPIARLLATENSFEGELARFGHGLQRSYLLALLQELSLVDTSSEPTLILGVEEPELYQHPPQARHLASVFQSLSEGNAQVLVSTHSPLFVSGRYFESVRVVRRKYSDGTSSIYRCSFKKVCERLSAITGKKENGITAEAARLQQALQPHVNEMFFSPRVVLVEGPEDLAYIMSCMLHTGRAADFRRSGGNIIPVIYKSSMKEPLIIAQELGIPVFAVFDGDSDKTNNKDLHEKDNRELLKILGGDDKQPFPVDAVWADSFVQWPENIGKYMRAECGETDWNKEYNLVNKELGNPEGSFQKNNAHIGLHIGRLHHANKIPQSLIKLCDTIIDFCLQQP